MRHDQPSPLPEPAPGGRDVTAEGAQLLRRRAELAAGGRVVRKPLQRRGAGSRRELSPLHQPTSLRGRDRAHALGAWGGPPGLHGARPDRPHALPLPAQRRRRLRAPGAGRRPRRPAERLREPQPLFVPARAISRAVRHRADRGRRPRGAEGRASGHDAPPVHLPGRRPRLHVEAVRARVGDRNGQGQRPVPDHGPGRPASGAAGSGSQLRPPPRVAALAGRAGRPRP